MKNIIKLRAHHVLCLAFFEGKGYSDNFVNHMQSVLDELENNPVIQITAGCDLICNECPNLKGGVCATPDLVREYDNRVLSLCGLAENDIISWNDFSSLAAEKIIRDGKREGVCGNCEWNEICKSKE